MRLQTTLPEYLHPLELEYISCPQPDQSTTYGLPKACVLVAIGGGSPEREPYPNSGQATIILAF